MTVVSTRRLWLAVVLSAVLIPVGFAVTRGDADGDVDVDTQPEPPPPPANTELAVILMRAGLDAPALCAAGVSAEAVDGLVDPIASQIAGAPDTLPGLDDGFAQTRVTRDRLQRLVRSGQSTQEDVMALAQAQADFAGAQAARDDFFDGLRASVASGVDPLAAATLGRFQSNRNWKFPTQYLVADREQAQWVELRDALAVKRIHENYGEDFPVSVQVYLAAVDANPAISAAKVNLDTNLAAVQTAWNLAVSR